MPTIGAAGLAWKACLDVLRELGVRVVRIAFDADSVRNLHVARALAECAEGLVAAGYAIELERWDVADGKGIDDVLAAGKTPELLVGDAALAAVRDILATAAGPEQAQPRVLDCLRQTLQAGGVEALFRNVALLRDLARLRVDDPSEFAVCRAAAATAKIKLRDLDRALAPLVNELRQQRPPPTAAADYRIEAGKIVWLKSTRDGPVMVPLANFVVRIVEQLVLDDGAERTLTFAVEGELFDGMPLPRSTVLAKDFIFMRWPVALWGTRAVIMAGFGTADHLRTAIQLLSGCVPRRTVYSHTGWREINGRWYYLHAGGAIGADGPASDVDVAVHKALEGYVLPLPPRGPELLGAVRASLRMLSLGPERITMPLLAAAYRAALGKADFSVHLAGDSGLYKSEIAALIQQHYGAGMDARHLPGSWSSTGNALEAVAFLAADAIFVVDDYVPTGAAGDIQRTRKELARLIRAQGNNSGRGRCRSDGSPQPSRPPRGLIVSTGEDAAAVRSVQARMLVLDVSPGDLGPPPPAPNPNLTACQKDAAVGLYAQALSAFVQWLAPRYEAIRQRLPQERAELREKAIVQRTGGHARTPALVADLALGLKYFLNFAVDAGAIMKEERDDLAQRGWKALGDAAREHAKHTETSEPCGMFCRLLAAALANGSAHVAGPGGGEPVNQPAWGWRQITVGAGPYRHTEWQPRGQRIGWVNGSDLYLEPEASHAAAQELARDQGEALPVTPRVLHKRLKERGLLVSWDIHRQRTTVRRTLEGISDREVLHLRADALTCAQPSGPSVEAASRTESTGGQDVAADGQADGPADGNGPGEEHRPPEPSAKAGENQVGGRFGRWDTGEEPQSWENSELL
jgi:hypothetical protein